MTPDEQLHPDYSDAGAVAVPWTTARARLGAAQLAWLVTVRPDGRPHATPVVPVFHDDRVYFHTGRHEVKCANLSANHNVLVLAGDTSWEQGLDVMVDGVASEVTDPERLHMLADLFRDRWDGRWKLGVDSSDSGGSRLVADDLPDVELVAFEVTPRRARSHAKGDPFGQTDYRFADREPDRQDR